eukprot:1150147-Alexandrium_andersonii.AAC.1
MVLLAAPATKRARCMPAAPRLRTRGGFADPRRRADTARATSELVRARCGAAAPRGFGRAPTAVVSAWAH